MQTVQLGLSPCPNDTYTFYAMLSELIGDSRIQWSPCFLDIDDLNAMALDQSLAVSKMSFRAYYEVSDHYRLLDSGSALGHGCGPLLVSRHGVDHPQQGWRIAIPGGLTTARFLLEYAYDQAFELHQVLFSDIPLSIAEGKFDAGVIIHESRFVYQEYGLQLIADLGAVWELGTKSAIPLGCIAVRNDIADEMARYIESDIRSSILYAHDHKEEVMYYMKHYAQELSDTVIWQHVHMFVNGHSLSLGDDGQHAVHVMFDLLNQSAGKNKRPRFVTS